MKHIHMKKPDIKGFFQKIRNLKMQDIKEHFKERKERRIEKFPAPHRQSLLPI